MARPPWCLAFDLILPLLKLHRQPPRFWPAARRLHLLLHLDLQLPTASLLDRRRCAHSLRCSINWAAIASADPWPQHHLTPKTPKTPAAWHPGPRTGLWILLLPYLLLACLPTTRRKSFFSFVLEQIFVPNEKTRRHQSARISWSRAFLHCASHPPVTSWIAAAALIAPRQLVTSSPLRLVAFGRLESWLGICFVVVAAKIHIHPLVVFARDWRTTNSSIRRTGHFSPATIC